MMSDKFLKAAIFSGVLLTGAELAGAAKDVPVEDKPGTTASNIVSFKVTEFEAELSNPTLTQDNLAAVSDKLQKVTAGLSALAVGAESDVSSLTGATGEAMAPDDTGVGVTFSKFTMGVAVNGDVDLSNMDQAGSEFQGVGAFLKAFSQAAKKADTTAEALEEIGTDPQAAAAADPAPAPAAEEPAAPAALPAN